MSAHTKELTKNNFDDTIKKGSVVVDFWAEWCGPCKMMAPHFEAAAAESSGSVVFGKVNVDNEYELSERFDVMSIPTLIFFKDGEIVDQIAGALTKEMLQKKVKDIF